MTVTASDQASENPGRSGGSPPLVQKHVEARPVGRTHAYQVDRRYRGVDRTRVPVQCQRTVRVRARLAPRSWHSADRTPASAIHTPWAVRGARVRLRCRVLTFRIPVDARSGTSAGGAHPGGTPVDCLGYAELVVA